VFAAADQRRFRPWLIASALVHVFGAALLLVLRPALPVPQEPLRVVRVDLIPGPLAAPGPPAPTPAPPAAAPAPPPPAPRPAPAKPRVAAKPPAPKPLAPKPAAPAPPEPAPAPPTPGSVGGSGAGEGAALAAVSSGPPGWGGGGADALADYIARLQRAIDAQKRYPSMARRRGIEGVVTVRLAIDARGTLQRTALVGRPPEILARSTREAVESASPFPPPPAGAIQVEFPVRYEIVD
jgi:protein TonB